ncbi:MAG: response regulator [Nitrospirae bacterium]|nr:response regulator [Nitrospirota bacterium]
MRRILDTILREGGFDVVGEASDGDEALLLCGRLHPDIVCLDMVMPKRDGIQVLEEIKAANPRAIVIMLSAFSTLEKMGEASARGADGFIVKPLTSQRVLEVINRAIQSTESVAIPKESRSAAIRESYRRELPGRIDGIIDDIRKVSLREFDEKSVAALGNELHSLAGSAAVYGYPAISSIAREIEKKLRVSLATPATFDASDMGAMLASLAASIPSLVPSVASGVDHGVSALDIHPKLSDRLIFLADENEADALEMEAQIENFGYEIRRFTRPAELIDALRNSSPAAVILGIMFPEGGLAGIEAAATIRQMRKDKLPIILVTFKDDLVTRLQAARAGADEFFTKPIDPQNLIDRLNVLAERREPEPYRILIVEDDPSTAALNSSIIEQAGMITRTVTNPLDAMPVLSEFNPDLVLMDLYMTECDGMELASVIRQYGAYDSIPIVFFSAELNPDRHMEALMHGGDDFLVKSINPAHLVLLITARVKRYRILRSYMVKDGLTGLLNHTRIIERLGIEIARSKRDNKPLAFAMIDLDFFKVVNDTYGHAIGDMVLKTVSRVLRQRMRRTDIIGRYGGEEFAVIFPNTDADSASRVLDIVRNGFSSIRHPAGNGDDFSLTFSCGVAELQDYSDTTSLIGAADRALYEAKNTGRNRVARN